MLDPHGLLKHVYTDLVEVIEGASQTPQGFMVVYGLRTKEAEAQAVASGHSTTMHSRHLADVNYSGMAMAVDVAALTDAHIDWSVKLYPAIAKQIKEAAFRLHIPIEWGGDWTTFKDWGHFQLPWHEYP